jgi:hypothetical protein
VEAEKLRDGSDPGSGRWISDVVHRRSLSKSHGFSTLKLCNNLLEACERKVGFEVRGCARFLCLALVGGYPTKPFQRVQIMADTQFVSDVRKIEKDLG